MNLIEQLGGYERASKFCDKEIKDGGYPYGLIDELLEYRRENNIFENGDKVTAKDNFRIGVISEIKDGSAWIIFDSASKMLSPFWHIRHATDEEIEQGFRDE